MAKFISLAEHPKIKGPYNPTKRLAQLVLRQGVIDNTGCIILTPATHPSEFLEDKSRTQINSRMYPKVVEEIRGYAKDSKRGDTFYGIADEALTEVYKFVIQVASDNVLRLSISRLEEEL
jgi:hypothetical protein